MSTSAAQLQPGEWIPAPNWTVESLHDYASRPGASPNANRPNHELGSSDWSSTNVMQKTARARNAELLRTPARTGFVSIDRNRHPCIGIHMYSYYYLLDIISSHEVELACLY